MNHDGRLSKRASPAAMSPELLKVIITTTAIKAHNYFLTDNYALAHEVIEEAVNAIAENRA